jgi:hypothetical protein
VTGNLSVGKMYSISQHYSLRVNCFLAEEMVTSGWPGGEKTKITVIPAVEGPNASFSIIKIVAVKNVCNIIPVNTLYNPSPLTPSAYNGDPGSIVAILAYRESSRPRLIPCPTKVPFIWSVNFL